MSIPVSSVHEVAASESRKAASLIALYAELDRQSHLSKEVPRKRLSPSEFYENYFYPNRPVIVEGLMAEWPALSKWTLPWFRSSFGDYEVEVHSRRTMDPLYERHFKGNCSTMNFGDFVSLLEDPNESNDVYLVGRNALLDRPEFSVMLEDIANPEGFLDPHGMRPPHVKLWVGPRGTITPLHHDRGSVFFAQISGRKHVKFISPFHLPSMYNDPDTCYSDVNLDNGVDLNQFPAMRDVVVSEAVIGPGDFLLIPVAWWHWVRALDPSISLTFKNFMFRAERIAWNYR